MYIIELTHTQKPTIFLPTEQKQNTQKRARTKAERQVFPNKHIDNCLVDEIHRISGRNAVIEIGIDFGFESMTAITVVEKFTRTECQVLERKAWKRLSIENSAPRMCEIINKCKNENLVVKADNKPDYYHGWLEKYTDVPINYIHGPAHKDAIISQMARKVREHHVHWLRSDIELTAQMRKYKRKMRSGDDLVDSLGLAIYEFPDAKKKDKKEPAQAFFF